MYNVVRVGGCDFLTVRTSAAAVLCSFSGRPDSEGIFTVQGRPTSGRRKDAKSSPNINGKINMRLSALHVIYC
jgi:hypothetical protein